MAKTLYDFTLKDEAFDRHALSINTSRTIFHEHILRTVQDTQQLAAIPSVKNYIEQPTPSTLVPVQQVFLDSSVILGRYDQIRLIDVDGQELIRINNQFSDAKIAPFDEFSAHEFQRAIRQKTPLTVIALDIDYFKKVNDTHGHFIGDEVLKALADCCVKILRVTDIMARFGGEEFVILLSDTNFDIGFAKADELRQALANLPISLPDGKTLNFTASFGVATLSDELDSIDKLLKAADAALYKAKETGRNKVC